MTLKTAKKAVDFGLTYTNPEYFRVGFFGGEPLMKWQLIKDIVAYTNKKAKRYKFVPNYVLSTNGTIINNKILDFLKQNNFRISFSLDGDVENHNMNRKCIDGKNRFNDILDNLEKYKKQALPIQLVSVVDPTNVHNLFKTIKFLTNLGINYILSSPNLNAKWTNNLLNIWFCEYKKIIDYYKKNLLDKGVFLNFLNKDFNKKIQGGHAPEDIIKTGARIVIDFKGDIFTCDRLAAIDSNDKYKIGNIFNLNEGILKDIRLLNVKLWRINGCDDCKINQICGKFSRYAPSGFLNNTIKGTFSYEYNSRVKQIEKYYNTQKLNYLEISPFCTKIK